MKKEGGFTLIELIIVIAILGILAMVLLPKFTGFTKKAKETTIQAEATTIKKAIEAMAADTGAYPTDADKSKLWEYTGKDFTESKDANKTATLKLGKEGAFTYTKIVNGANLTATCTKDGKITVEDVKESNG